MNTTHDALSSASRSLEHAVDGLHSAVTLDHLPRVIRGQVCDALITTTRVAALLEALAEGVVDLLPGKETA